MTKNIPTKIKISLLGILLLTSLLQAIPVYAQTTPTTPEKPATTATEKTPETKKTSGTNFRALGLNPNETGQFMDNCIKDGNCSVCAVLATFAYAIEWMMKIGVLGAFIMITYYGISLLLSAGSSEKVKKAKDGIIGTLIGLVVLFSGWTIVNTVLSSIIKGQLDANVTIFGKNWSSFCNE